MRELQSEKPNPQPLPTSPDASPFRRGKRNNVFSWNGSKNQSLTKIVGERFSREVRVYRIQSRRAISKNNTNLLLIGYTSPKQEVIQNPDYIAPFNPIAKTL